jgi:phosphonate transport system substrate-binding protein
LSLVGRKHSINREGNRGESSVRACPESSLAADRPLARRRRPGRRRLRRRGRQPHRRPGQADRGAQAAAAATAAPATAAPATTAKPGGTIKFGLIPDESSEKVLNRFKSFTAFMEKQLDMKIDAIVGTDYSATIEAMKSKKIDLAFFGPFSYILANQVAEAEVLVQPAKPDGTFSTYHSVIITKKTTGITKLEDLKGKNFAFVDPASTSGHLIPRSILVAAGLDPDKDMKPIFAGGHDASVLAVANGRVDAGATFEDQVNNMDKAGVIKKDDLLVVRKSDPIPDGPIAVRKDYDPALRTKVTAMFETLPGDVIKEAYGGSGPAKFVKGDDKVYDSLREVSRVLKLDLTKLR